jgi:hypothetical protein
MASMLSLPASGKAEQNGRLARADIMPDVAKFTHRAVTSKAQEDRLIFRRCET